MTHFFNRTVFDKKAKKHVEKVWILIQHPNDMNVAAAREATDADKLQYAREWEDFVNPPPSYDALLAMYNKAKSKAKSKREAA